MTDKEMQDVLEELRKEGLLEIVRYNEKGIPVYRRTLAGKVEALKQGLGEGRPELN